LATVERAAPERNTLTETETALTQPKATTTLSADHEDLRRTVHRFLADKSSEPEVRRLMETEHGHNELVWQQMAVQLGLQGLIIPESYGGSGFGYFELALVLEEMGRVLLCAPYFSTVALAVNLLLALDDETANSTYLPGIAAGETIATVALVEPSGRWDAEGVTLQATQAGSQWRLTGEKLYVLDGALADLVLVVARAPGGVSVFAVGREAQGFTTEALSTMDQTRKQARLVFSATPATLIGAEGDGSAAVATMLDLAAVALAAEQVGGAQRVLDMAVDYAKSRVQFGRPIGSFQAIKHKCADMLVEVETARSAAYYAAQCAADEAEELPVMASLVQAFCSDAYFHGAAQNVQIHGGIGFTWEHPAHLYLKRAKSSELLFGDATYHRELLADRLGID
jgi:alkylation response protein AidB-like acyl-CoA dehydrogenase